mgnify:CR=1 FL=1
MEDLAIVISLFNPNQHHLKKILNEFSGINIYLVDDNPNSHVDIRFFKNLKNVSYNKNVKNLGIAASLNGILEILPDYKYLLFLDQDTIISGVDLESHLDKFISIKSYNKMGIGVSSYYHSKKY